MSIKVGDIIKVEYEGTLDDGTIFDSTALNDGKPMKFEVGAGHILKGFENAVIGKEVGDSVKIRLEPSEAYGTYNPSLLQNIPRTQFPEDFNPEPGMVLQLSDPSGHVMLAAVNKIDDNEVEIDLNHPMAGKTLNFKIKVIETGCEPDPPHECGCGCGHDH